MKVRLTLAAVMLLAGGCDDASDERPITPEEAMIALALKQGYGVAGIPVHNGTRWTSNSRIVNCTGKIVLYSNVVPATALPTSFIVHSVAGTEFAGSPTDMSADDLLGQEGMRAKLGCS